MAGRSSSRDVGVVIRAARPVKAPTKYVHAVCGAEQATGAVGLALAPDCFTV
jgi:hypothetical protein